MFMNIPINAHARFFLSRSLFMEDDFWNYFRVLPVFAAVILVLIRLQASRLSMGSERRNAYEPGLLFHPKPSINWRHRKDISYEHGLLNIEAQTVWWQSFRPRDAETKTVIVMYHGYGDHSDYILHEVAHDLAVKSGKRVLIFDQPGFGRSDGLWAYIPDWFAHVNMCAQATRRIVRQLCGKSRVSLIGYGHSMGGGLLITCAIQHPRMFDGLILSAPMCGISANLRKHYLIEKFLFFLADIFPTAPITPVPDLGALCFEDPKFYDYTKQTNHLGYRGKPRLGTAKSMLLAQEWLSANGHRLSTPFLILHGTKDMITSLDSSVDLYRTATSSDKTIEILDGYFHSILGPGQSVKKSQRAFSIVVDWINSRF